MKEKSIFKIINTPVVMDAIFISLLFLLPILLSLFFHLKTVETRMLFIGILALWILTKPLYSRASFAYITFFDVGIAVLFIYALLHFFLYSKTTLHYYMSWVFIGYFILFYIFRWALSTKKKSPRLLDYILILVVLSCLLQSIASILQYFDVINVSNKFFKLLGSFTSPNFLGFYISYGFIILVWYLTVVKTPHKLLCFFGILGLVLFGFLVVLSNSRGTWVALSVALLSLLTTSKQAHVFFKKFSSLRLVLGIILIFVSFLFATKYLYTLKPESVDGRIFTAQISAKEIAKQPLKGHGMFTFPGKYNKAKAEYFMVEERSWEDTELATYVFSPFNDYLLVAFELGLPFLLFLSGLIVLAVFKFRANRKSRIGLALFLSLLVFALFNSPMHSIYLMAVGILGAAVLITYGDIKPLKIYVSLPLKKVAVLSIFLLGCFGVYAITSKAIYQSRVQNYGKIDTPSKEKEFMNLSRFSEDNLFSEYILGRKLFDDGLKNKGLWHMEHAFEKSAAPKIGKQLAQCHMREGDYKRAEEIYMFNISVEPYRYEPRMDLLKLYIKLNRYKEIVKLSQEIVNLPIKIPSVEIDGYKKTAAKYLKNYSRSIDPSSNLKGSLSTIKIMKSSVLGKTLPYKIYLPPIEMLDTKLPVIYVNDGDNYIKKGKLPNILDSLITNKTIPPIAAVFLEPRDRNENWKKIRQELFLCNPLFADFFTEEFIPRVEKLYPISRLPKHRTILGVSFGGLAAAYLADRKPSIFKNIIMQSPAFHPCKDIYRQYSSKPKKEFKMYLSYGTGRDTERQDLPFIKILKLKGYDLKVNRVTGANHEWQVWSEQLSDILIHYFGKTTQ